MSWQTASFVLLALALAAGFAWYERERPPSRVLALVAALAALAVVGRLAFAAIPNVKPTTDIVLFAGYALGSIPGFMVGAITAIVSNIFLSQGPWTVWQMAGWGAVGIGGALLARVLRGREPNRIMLAAVCGAAGLAFGAWMDLYQWTLGARQDLDSYLVVAGSSLPYNIAHAVGNVLFCLLIGPAFVRALARYRRRLEVRWSAPAGAAAGLVVALLAVGLAVPPPAGAAGLTQRAERYLLRAQNSNGGFGGAPRQGSSPLYTGWAGLGLAAAGSNPADVHRRGGRSIVGYLRRGSQPSDIGEIERTVLLLRAGGVDVRSFRGRNLVAAITRRRRPDGSISGFVSYTAFGILALRAAGEPAGASTAAWLVGHQNADGGFGVAPASGSDADMTGASLQALAAVGRARGATARRAVRWLASNQNADGGYGLLRGRPSNAQSTAYAVQGLTAVGARPRAVGRALAYLRRLARGDGSIAYSATSTQTPVWVTAQALMALRRQALPIAAVRRAPRAGGSARDTDEELRGAGSSGSRGSSGDGVGARSSAGGAQDGGAGEDRASAGPSSGGPTGDDGSGRATTGLGSEDARAPSPGEPGSGLRLDPAVSDGGAGDGGGPAGWVLAAGAAALAALVALAWWLHRRRLWRRAGGGAAESAS